MQAALDLATAVATQTRLKTEMSAQAADAGLTFLAPIQQAGSNLHIDLDNRPVNTTPSFGKAWPAAFALLAWGLALTRNPGFIRSLAIALGWTLLAWASLRLPTDTRPFTLVIAAFAAIHCVLPAISAARRTTSTPTPPAPTPTPILSIGALNRRPK